MEPGAPLLGIELRRLGFPKESLEYRDEALWRLELWQMADPFEDLEAAPGNRLVGALAVADGDDRIARAPDDQHGEALGEVMPVAGVDPLTAHADDRAQRGKERGAAVAVSKRRVAASDLNDVSGWPHSDGRQAAPDRVSRSPRWRGGRGQ